MGSGEDKRGRYDSSRKGVRDREKTEGQNRIDTDVGPRERGRERRRPV